MLLIHVMKCTGVSLSVCSRACVCVCVCVCLCVCVCELPSHIHGCHSTFDSRGGSFWGVWRDDGLSPLHPFLIHPEKYTQTHTPRDRHTHTHTHTHTITHKNTEKERNTQTHTHTDTHMLIYISYIETPSEPLLAVPV